MTLAIIWPYHEPQEGKYHEAALDDIIRVCDFAKYNLRVIINFYTMLSENSWTIPQWLSPWKFEAVFINEAARQSWLNFLNHCASRLSNVESIWSWHMMNEPARGSWACNVSIDEYLDLWAEMKAIFKLYSDRPISVRFAAQLFDSPNHFNNDQRILDLLDYLSLNWYECYYSDKP